MSTIAEQTQELLRKAWDAENKSSHDARFVKERHQQNNAWDMSYKGGPAAAAHILNRNGKLDENLIHNILSWGKFNAPNQKNYDDTRFSTQLYHVKREEAPHLVANLKRKIDSEFDEYREKVRGKATGLEALLKERKNIRDLKTLRRG